MDIPENVLEALNEVRETGLFNMLDRAGIIEYLDDEEEVVEWLIANKRRYMEALIAMGEKYN